MQNYLLLAFAGATWFGIDYVHSLIWRLLLPWVSGVTDPAYTSETWLAVFFGENTTLALRISGGLVLLWFVLAWLLPISRWRDLRLLWWLCLLGTIVAHSYLQRPLLLIPTWTSASVLWVASFVFTLGGFILPSLLWSPVERKYCVPGSEAIRRRLPI